MKHLLFILSLFIVIPATAQLNLSGQFVTPSGDALQAATVSLYKGANDSLQAVQSALTDETGAFSMTGLSSDNYLLKVTYVDQELYTQKILLDKTTDLGKITIEDIANKIDEVTITQHKPAIKMEHGKFIYTPSLVNAGNAIDVIKTTPMLSVQDDAISIIGKGIAGIKVDNKYLKMSMPQIIAYLKSIPAENVANIEIVRMPAADADAENANGYINIVLKQQQEKGMSWGLSTNGYYVKQPGGGIGANARINLGKVALYANANFQNRKGIRVGSNEFYYNDHTIKEQQDQQSLNNSLNTTAGIDYTINPKLTLGASAIYTIDKTKNDDHFTTVYTGTNNLLDSTLITPSYSPQHNSNIVYNVYAEQKFDSSGKKIRFDLDQIFSNQNAQQDFTNYIYDATGNVMRAPEPYLSTSDGNMNILTTNFACSLPFSKISYTFGGKLTFIKSDNNVNRYINLPQGLIPEAAQADSFAYSETIQALYAQVGKSWEKWDLQLGLRGEFTQTKGISKTYGVTNKNTYFNLFPTASVSYKADDKNNFMLSLRRGIQRPYLSMLNPFKRYVNENAYTQGNPFLQAYNTNSAELSYMYHNRWTITGAYSHAANTYAEITYVAENSPEQVTGMFNFEDMDQYSLGVNTNYTILERWQCYPALYLIHNNVISHNPAVSNSSGNYFYFQCNNQVALNKNKTFMLDTNFYYVSPNTAGTFDIKSMWGQSVGLTCLALQKKLEMNVSVNDVFRSGSFRYNSVVNDINRVREVYNGSRYASFTVKYNFSKGVNKNTGKSQVNQEDINRAKS